MLTSLYISIFLRKTQGTCSLLFPTPLLYFNDINYYILSSKQSQNQAIKKPSSEVSTIFSSIDNQSILKILNCTKMERKPMLKKIGHQSTKDLSKPTQSYVQAQSQVSSKVRETNTQKKRTYVKYFQNHPFSSPRVQNSSSYSQRNGNQQSQVLRGDMSNYRDFSRSYCRDSVDLVATEHIVALQERLRNIHENYKKLIDEEKKKNQEKGEVIMGLLEEMQTMHNQKMQGIRKMIEESENQKKEVGFVDDKMVEIKGNIDDLINQSSNLKSNNDQLERKIAQKTKINEQKQRELEELNEELLESRTELEQFQLNNLKNNKINRQIMEIFNTASSLPN